MKIRPLALLLPFILAAAFPAYAQRGGAGRMAGGSDAVESLDNTIAASGLTIAFPAGFECEAISSPFASPSRHDGSLRRNDRNSGLHGGIDLTLEAGTPLLAVAAGKTVATGEGGQLEGIFIWLQHAPTDTGLPFWTFTKYQHLSTLPVLKVGDPVRVGQVIGYSGNSGTVSKHYGPAGYPHLHLNTLYGHNPDYQLKGMYESRVEAAGAILDDPLILYLGQVGDLSEVRQLPAARRKVMVPVADAAGVVYPSGSKTVWPVHCRKKP